MAIEKIDEKKCVGCGTCALSCPMDVIHMNSESRKAEIRYPEECVVCCYCIADCPSQAITISPGKRAVWFSSGY